jgi:hypothetical protein
MRHGTTWMNSWKRGRWMKGIYALHVSVAMKVQEVYDLKATVKLVEEELSELLTELRREEVIDGEEGE